MTGKCTACFGRLATVGANPHPKHVSIVSMSSCTHPSANGGCSVSLRSAIITACLTVSAMPFADFEIDIHFCETRPAAQAVGQKKKTEKKVVVLKFTRPARDLGDVKTAHSRNGWGWTLPIGTPGPLLLEVARAASGTTLFHRQYAHSGPSGKENLIFQTPFTQSCGMPRPAAVFHLLCQSV